ncbi:MAG: hypothetical protein ABI769_16690 [Pseudomonadota bacterium]
MNRHGISISAVCAGFGLLLGLSSQASFGLGGQFGFEFAIDAPWRLEPVKGPDGTLTYGPIPITVIFDDAVFEIARPGVGGFVNLDPIDIGRLREVRVVEWIADQPHPQQPVTTVSARQFREIERKGPVSTVTVEPDHDLCHPGPAQSCDDVLNISRSHEWHGAFWYTPKAPVTPGRNIHLEVTVITELPGGVYTREWKNYLVVHAGEAPLPRFADNWLYGDFHYHSQMTDNEGESGYSYRNVARALGASGMDFVFATDHASNSEQFNIVKTPREFCADKSHDKCSEARDFNPNRFRVAKSLLYGNTGINTEIALEADTRGLARLRSANVLPQVYLGEEVDSQVEISPGEFNEGLVHYGDGRTYAWPDAGHCLEHSSAADCRKKYSHAVDGAYVMLDEQGVPLQETVEDKLGVGTLNDVVQHFVPDGTQPAPSRQHLIYFPSSVSQNSDGFIGSDTGTFGGASKRLGDVVGEVERGGVAFLAHPLDSAKPGGPGPDIIPYTDRELDIAWRSAAILGLQFWNENDRRVSAPDRRSPSVMLTGANSDNPRAYHFWFNWPFQGNRYGAFPWQWDHTTPAGKMATMLYHGAYTWDRYLRKGVDAAQLRSLSWLAPGQPRRWFMAGGSDSHGDFNYRRYGQPGMDRWTDVPVGDTAIGQPRNLVSMASPLDGLPQLVETGVPTFSGPTRYTNQQVIQSLRAGRFSVTDGPAIRIALDRNLNGKIDESDTQMGGVLDFYPGDRIPLLVEWWSTPEFGPIAHVDVYVGNDKVTFAPRDHGPGIPGGIGQQGLGSYTFGPSSVMQVQLADAYGRFSRAPLPADIAYHGTAAIYLGPAQFALARAEGSLSYVRAFASTITVQQAADAGVCPSGETAGSHCGNRYAFANPVWTRYVGTCPAPSRSRVNAAVRAAAGVLQKPASFVDQNGNRVPDACENTLVNACPPQTNPTGAAGEITDRFRHAITTAGTHELRDANAPPGPPELVSTDPPPRAIPDTSCQVLPAPAT